MRVVYVLTVTIFACCLADVICQPGDPKKPKLFSIFEKRLPGNSPSTSSRDQISSSSQISRQIAATATSDDGNSAIDEISRSDGLSIDPTIGRDTDSALDLISINQAASSHDDISDAARETFQIQDALDGEPTELDVWESSPTDVPDLFPIFKSVEESKKHGLTTFKAIRLRSLGERLNPNKYKQGQPKQFDPILGRFVFIGEQIRFSALKTLRLECMEFGRLFPLYKIAGSQQKKVFQGIMAMVNAHGSKQRKYIQITEEEVEEWNMRETFVKNAQLRNPECLGMTYFTEERTLSDTAEYVPELQRAIYIQEEILISVIKGTTIVATKIGEVGKQMQFSVGKATVLLSLRAQINRYQMYNGQKTLLHVTEEEHKWWESKFDEDNRVTREIAGEEVIFYKDSSLTEPADKFVQVGHRIVFHRRLLVCMGPCKRFPNNILWRCVTEKATNPCTLRAWQKRFEKLDLYNEDRFVSRNNRQRIPVPENDGMYHEVDPKVNKWLKIGDTVIIQNPRTEQNSLLTFHHISKNKERMLYTNQRFPDLYARSISVWRLFIDYKLSTFLTYWCKRQPIQNFDPPTYVIDKYRERTISRLSIGSIEGIFGVQDSPGSVYVYCCKGQRQEDDQPTLLKIGMTSQVVEKRIHQTEKINNEKYEILYSLSTFRRVLLESLVHVELESFNTPRNDIQDGKTEWFLVSLAKTIQTIQDLDETMMEFPECLLNR